MFISDKFTFLHVPKTGGQFVLQSLSEVLEIRNLVAGSGLYHGSANEIPEQFKHLPKFAFTRNPWDWYVSWYHHQRKLFIEGEAYAVHLVTSHNNSLDFKQTVTNLLTLDEQPQMLSKIKKIILHDFERHRRNGWKLNDMDSIIDHQHGFYSHKLNLITSFSNDDVHFGRMETLTDDLIQLVFQYYDLSLNKIQQLKAKEKVNTTVRTHYRDYYDEELKQLVAEKDKQLIKYFDYEF